MITILCSGSRGDIQPYIALAQQLKKLGRQVRITAGKSFEGFISQRSESNRTITMVLLPSECRERKLKYPAPWGGKGGEASAFQGLPWGIDTFHS